MIESSPLQRLKQAQTQINQVIVGKTEAVETALACLLAGGHLLIEDIPGVGKTTLAHSLAISLGTSWQRIQFTADLLPADILGLSVYQRSTEEFKFHPGPIFHQLILADEINRGTAKTQSALLEAMAEKRVTVEGKTRDLPQPFFVIATQNPLDTAGTFPLPDSQLDRFLLSISLGYPAAESELELLAGIDRQQMLQQLPVVLQENDLSLLQQQTREVHRSDSLLGYLQALLLASREWPGLRNGLSPRAGLALLHCASALAVLAGRDYCQPEDIQRIFPALCRHRLVYRDSVNNSQTDTLALATEILHSVPVLEAVHQRA